MATTLDDPDPFSRVPSVPELRLTFSNEELTSMACAAGGLFAVHVVACAALRVFCSRWLDSLPPKERHDVGIRLGSSVWGVVSTTWAAALLLPRWWDIVYGHPVGRLYADPPFETCSQLFAAAIGYFIWDLITTLYYGYGAEYVFHAVISIAVYALPKLMPPSFLQFYGCFFILWEVSLPFVNARHGGAVQAEPGLKAPDFKV